MKGVSEELKKAQGEKSKAQKELDGKLKDGKGFDEKIAGKYAEVSLYP